MLSTDGPASSKPSEACAAAEHLHTALAGRGVTALVDGAAAVAAAVVGIRSAAGGTAAAVAAYSAVTGAEVGIKAQHEAGGHSRRWLRTWMLLLMLRTV